MTTLASFDGTEGVKGELARPARGELADALSGPGPMIPRGAALSYCAASAGAGARSISALALDRILALDDGEGTVTIEPGVRVGDLVAQMASRGWLPPVLPGHPAITVGGCIGFNVHGKSHIHGCNFLHCVEALTLLHPDHGEVECSLSKEPELFELTLGGFGLTGFVTRARLRLQRLPGRTIVRERFATRNLIEAVELMEAKRGGYTALYSWNDLNRRGDDFGRGSVFGERYEEGEATPLRAHFPLLSPESRGRVPLSLLGRWNGLAATRTYGLLEAFRPRLVRIPLLRGLFPIQGKEFYFFLFGRRGMREYQMLLSRAAWEPVTRALDRLLAHHGVPTTLGSLKLLEGETSFLNFCGSGVCLTLDVPAHPDALPLFAALDELVIEHEGIVSLSKDSRLRASVVERIFPEYERFREQLVRYDPNRRFDSLLRRRIGV